MNNNPTPYDMKKTVKQGAIYLLIAFPFVLVVAGVLNYVNAPLWLIMLANITVGGVVVWITYIIHGKIKAKKNANKDPNKFDPFKD